MKNKRLYLPEGGTVPCVPVIVQAPIDRTFLLSKCGFSRCSPGLGGRGTEN